MPDRAQASDERVQGWLVIVVDGGHPLFEISPAPLGHDLGEIADMPGQRGKLRTGGQDRVEARWPCSSLMSSASDLQVSRIRNPSSPSIVTSAKSNWLAESRAVGAKVPVSVIRSVLGSVDVLGRCVVHDAVDDAGATEPGRYRGTAGNGGGFEYFSVN
ncbi:hypothetical protein [Nocardia amikacinitolerans]|uniref:hypothetical protein n=1 Tax=Nocardia amikacinitolerans TaxID=756689 RepID=UPI0020A36370|nr:hypothetical protein [Nocardia amikacinitolerans]